MSDDKKKKNKKPSITFMPLNQQASDILQKSLEIDEQNATIKGIEYLGEPEKKNVPRLALTSDPIASDQYSGTKTKRKLLPNSVIKDIASSSHLIASIIRARSNTMSMFGHLKKDRFDIGFETKIKPEFEEEMNNEQIEKVRDRIHRFNNILASCGKVEGLKNTDKMGLPEFMYLTTQNAVKFGYLATEIVRDESENDDELGNFHRFRPVDAGTIERTTPSLKSEAKSIRKSAEWLLSREQEENVSIETDLSKQFPWAQVIDNVKRQIFTEDEMLVHNFYPSTDIEHNGYPLTPIDTCLSSITTHLSIEAYNKLFFQNGRAAKGMLVVKSEEIDQTALEELKQQYMASINNVSNSFRTPIFGVGREDDVDWVPTESTSKDGEFQFLYDQIARNILSSFNMSPDELPGYGHLSKATTGQGLSECFHPGTFVLTKDGSYKAQDILGEEREKKIEVWTGKNWEKARIFRTGEKQVVKTTLKNNLSLLTSPDHRFFVIGEQGEPVWKQQKDLVVGDYVLTNLNAVEGREDLVPSYKGKKLTKEIMEVLGFMTGDGTLVAPRKRSGGQLMFFYHHEKEAELQQLHAQWLEEFGVNAAVYRKEVSDDVRLDVMKRGGFSTASSVRLRTVCYDTDFVNWLFSLGFTPSKGGKTIPSLINALPVEYRAAFLRGFFSADGHVTVHGAVILTVQSERLREATRLLLSELGISTHSFKGLNRRSFGNKKEFSHKISIKDTNKYWDLIGFRQQYKQDRKRLKKWDIGALPVVVMKNMSDLLIKSDNFKTLPKPERDIFVSVVAGRQKTTRQYITKIAEKLNFQLPEWFVNYEMEPIAGLDVLNETVSMVDVEVFDNTHAFVLNGMVVHNSNSEFKLTAARDTGLRPLILRFQEFFNEKLFPAIDPELAQICFIEFSGLDAQTRDQEAVRLQQEAPIYGTYNQVLKAVDREKIAPSMGGDFPFSQSWQLIADKYNNVGQLMSYFNQNPTAVMDPLLRYKRDGFHMQYLQLLMQLAPEHVKALVAPRGYSLDIIKKMIQDAIEEDGE